MAALKIEDAFPSASYGRELAYRGDLAGVRKLLNRVMTQARLNDYAALGGYFLALSDMCGAAKSRGARFSIEPPSREAVAHALRTDVGDLLEAGTILQTCVFAAADAGFTWRLVADPAPAPPPEPAPPPPQEIRIVGMPSLHVASMPARKTATTIHRDEDGDMVGSHATETDA